MFYASEAYIRVKGPLFAKKKTTTPNRFHAQNFSNLA